MHTTRQEHKNNPYHPAGTAVDASNRKGSTWPRQTPRAFADSRSYASVRAQINVSDSAYLFTEGDQCRDQPGGGGV